MNNVERIKRNERLSAIVRILTDTPNRIHSLGEFCDLFGAAKSTVSEDLDLVASSFAHFDLGRIETVAGAAGGVRFSAAKRPARRSQSWPTGLRSRAGCCRADFYTPPT